MEFLAWKLTPRWERMVACPAQPVGQARPAVAVSCDVLNCGHVLAPEAVPEKSKPTPDSSTRPLKPIRPVLHVFWIAAPGVSVHVRAALDQLPLRLNTPLHLVTVDPTTG